MEQNQQLQNQEENLMAEALQVEKERPQHLNQEENLQEEAQEQQEEGVDHQNPNQNPNSLRIGIISTPAYREDLLAFHEAFSEINDKYGDAVTLVVFGYNGAEDMPSLFDGLMYEHAKGVNFVHYFKTLQALNLDVVLIPLINNAYNATSENYNKFLEAAAFSIPVVATDIYPYNSLIQSGRNGFLFKSKEDLLNIINYLVTNRHMIEVVGQQAHQSVIDHLNFTDENVDMIADLYD